MLLHHAVDRLHFVELPESVGFAAIIATIGNEPRLFLAETRCIDAEKQSKCNQKVLACSFGETQSIGGTHLRGWSLE